MEDGRQEESLWSDSCAEGSRKRAEGSRKGKSFDRGPTILDSIATPNHPPESMPTTKPKLFQITGPDSFPRQSTSMKKTIHAGVRATWAFGKSGGRGALPSTSWSENSPSAPAFSMIARPWAKNGMAAPPVAGGTTPTLYNNKICCVHAAKGLQQRQRTKRRAARTLRKGDMFRQRGPTTLGSIATPNHPPEPMPTTKPIDFQIAGPDSFFHYKNARTFVPYASCSSYLMPPQQTSPAVSSYLMPPQQTSPAVLTVCLPCASPADVSCNSSPT